MPDGSRRVVWAEWSAAAFTRALAGPRPVALLVETRWSAPCDRFRRAVLTSPGLSRTLESRFEPILVDADERPDLAERYTADGWPTLVALTPHGWPLAPIPTDDPAAGAARLAGIADAFDARRDELLRRVPGRPFPAGVPGPPDALAVVTAWLADWEAPGGEHRAAATPAAIGVAIERAERALRPDLLARALAVLDGLAASPLRDPATGLWFRAAPTAPAGWEAVQALDDQAAWVAVETAAVLARPTEDGSGRLASLVRAIDRSFGGPRGYAAARFLLDAAGDEARMNFAEACERDDRLFVDAQARMATATMRAGGALGMSTWTARAVDRLDDLVSAAYRRDGGVAHVLDPGPRHRGLLGDQVAVAAALLDAWEVSGRHAYLDAADEMLASTVRKFTGPDSAALRDRVPTTAGAGDVGLLGRPVHPPDANAAAAASLLRLAVHRDDSARRDAAHAILAACLAEVDVADPAHASLLGVVA